MRDSGRESAPGKSRSTAATTVKLAKLSLPVLPGRIYHRSTLFEHLDALGASAPVTWVSAPGGAGKTILIASYLERSGVPVLWYQIDAGDADIASFFYYLSIASAQARRSRRKALPLLTPEYLAGLATFARNWFREFYARLPQNAALVFDNYHEVSPDSPLHQVLLYALEELPAGVRVFVLSRSEPPSSLTRMRLGGTLAVVGWDSLRLTREESDRIVAMWRAEPDEDTLAAAYRRSHGWAAGLLLALQADDGDGSSTMFEAAGQQAVFDYFASEIFERAEPALQDFLLKTSLLPTIDVTAAVSLTGNPDARHMLIDLTARNHFTVRHATSPPTFEYHPLFRAFLMARAAEELPAQSYDRVRLTAAELLNGSGHPEDAVALLLSGDFWEPAATVILEHAPRLVQQGRGATVIQWLEALPAAVRRQVSWLDYWLGICRLPFDQGRSRRSLTQAYDGFKDRNDKMGCLLAAAAVVDSFIYEWRDFTELSRWIEDMEALLDERPAFPSQELEDRVTCALFLALMHRCPDHPDLRAWAQKVWNIVAEGADAQLRLYVGSQLMMYEMWWVGDLAAAGHLSTILKSLATAAKAPPLAHITQCWVDCGYYWMTADLDECLAAGRKGLEMAAETGIHIWDMSLLTQSVYGHLSRGEIAQAETMFEQMSAVLNTERTIDSALYYYVLGWRDYIHGEHQRARVHCERTMELLERSHAPLFATVAREMAGRLLAQQGERERGLTLIRTARARAQQMGAKTAEYMTWLGEAALALADGDKEAGVEAMRHWLAIGRQQNFQNHPWWNSQVMSRLYAEALANDIEVRYVRSIIRKRGLTPPEDMMPEHWPWPFRIFTLGRFAVVKDDQPLVVPAKAPRKSLELLRVLIAFGGRDLACGRVAETLWPDADGDVAAQSLKVAVHRLRKLLGSDEVLIVREGQITLDTRHCWVDCWALERLLSQLGEALTGDRDEQVAELTQRVFGLYGGAFLERDHELSSAIAYRERLRSRVLRQLDTVAAYWGERGAWKEAAECYRRTIEVEAVAEESYRGLIRCYLHLNLPAEALAAYRRCEQVLREVLGVNPAEETLRLVDGLLRN